MILVEIQNSWQLDLVRLYRHRKDFKKYYSNLVVTEVFVESGAEGLGQDLTVFFSDNHFCNVDNLDYKKLHKFLSQFFRTVSFASENPYDTVLDPEYFTLAANRNDPSHKKLFYDLCRQRTKNPDVLPEKMFGLHVLRPDVHRLGLLVELHRQGMLEHTDVRVGFRSEEFSNPEYRRSSNIDTVCFEFDICHQDLFRLIDSLPLGDRINFQDNATYRGKDHVTKDAEKCDAHSKFAIELICASSIHDHVWDHGEKIRRPMILKQPFLWLGPADCMRVLKLEGADIFDDVWDVSWDQYTESWLPTKIHLMVRTCEYIVKNFDVTAIKDQTLKGVEHNFEMLEREFFGPTRSPVDKWADCDDTIKNIKNTLTFD
jgi:hypothetical protein